MMPLFSREKSSLKGRWRLETVQDMRSSSSNPISCSENPIKIYGSKEEILARKSPETVDAPGFAPDASIPITLYGTPDWIRTSGLQSRSLSLYPAELRARVCTCRSLDPWYYSSSSRRCKAVFQKVFCGKIVKKVDNSPDLL